MDEVVQMAGSGADSVAAAAAAVSRRLGSRDAAVKQKVTAGGGAPPACGVDTSVGSGSRASARAPHSAPSPRLSAPPQALRLVKHACQRGSPELRRALAKQSAAVRELTSFRCPPDPFTGNLVWRRVQEAAAEALAAMHAAPEAPAPTSAALGVRRRRREGLWVMVAN